MFFVNSIVSRDESSFLKGVAIFSVILGHNVFFTEWIDSLWVFLNAYNVAFFFIITFLYGNAHTDLFDSSKKIFLKLFPIYFLSYVVYAFAYHFFPKDYSISLLDHVSAFSLGGQKIKHSTGFLLLWFFPAFIYFSFFKNLIYSKFSKILIASTSIFAFYSIYKTSYFSYLSMNAIFSGAYFIPYSFFCDFIIRNFYNKFTLILFGGIFLLFFISSFIININFPIPICIIPFCAFIFFYSLSKTSYVLESKIGTFFKYIGKNSLYLYISHSLIFYFFKILFFDKLELSIAYKSTISFLSTLIVSIIFAYFLRKIIFLYKQKCLVR